MRPCSRPDADVVQDRPIHESRHRAILRGLVPAAHVAGFLTRGDGAAARHFGRFYLEAVRAPGGWKIRVEGMIFPGPRVEETTDAEALVARLDAAGIQRAVVLSVAYWFDSDGEPDTPESERQMRAENDWTASQVARFPDRLVGFCSFNPLRDHALAELERCAAMPAIRGIKLHFGSSAVNLRDPVHLDKVRRVFAAADRRRMAIVVHLRGGDDYGAEHAAIFVEGALPAAPHVPVQIAHLWGGEAFSPEALAVYADAVAARRPGTRNLYFDISDAAAVAGGDPATLALMARRIRQIGLHRILYGSDAIGAGHPAPREAWAQLRRELPLTEEEMRTIARNAAPYLAPK